MNNELRKSLQAAVYVCAAVGTITFFTYMKAAKREREIYKTEIVNILEDYQETLYNQALTLDDKEKMGRLIHLADDFKYSSQLIKGEKNLDTIIQEKLKEGDKR